MSLPSGYARLEYIESSGTQYIDTGFVPDANTRVTMDFQLTAADSNNRCLFGVVGQFSFRWFGSSSVFRSNGSNSVNFPTGISGTSRHVVDKTATTTSIDDTYSVTTTRGTVSTSLYLFAQRASSGAANYSNTKLYSCKIYDGDMLVRDFIPCKNESDVIGLWDDAVSQFYANAGTGVFTAGPVVNLGGIFVKVGGVWKQVDNVTVNVH